ncbi:hypothetical protein FOA52_013366 [Chlamydomonas sp. UWO 241]|nr:hypothetical protein FOA52_013366 [Chlamydomonas sp. UWO 241]
MAKPESVLEHLGEEITSIVWPVSLCMALTVLLVRVLNPDGASSSLVVVMASAAWDEGADPDASILEKLGGAMLNALVFVAVVAAMTFVLLGLFKYKCYRFISAYMGFAVMQTLFLVTGVLVLMLLQKADIHMDIISLVYILWNFSVVGTMGALFVPVPLSLKQGYMVWVGVIIAYIFTWIPPWTGWVLMVAMALYDIVAVLTPGGPLKMLVELAIESDEPLPALIYEARPVGGGYRGSGRLGGAAGGGRQEGEGVGGAAGNMEGEVWGGGRGAAVEGERARLLPAAAPDRRAPAPARGGGAAAAAGAAAGRQRGAAPSGGDGGDHAVQMQPSPRSPPSPPPPPPPAASTPASTPPHLHTSGADDDNPGDEEGAPLLPRRGSSSNQRAGGGDGADAADAWADAAAAVHAAPKHAVAPPRRAQPPAPRDDDEYETPDGIKLGLGDFIFYSMLVGKASMTDMLTSSAAFVGILAGLGMTLACLMAYQKALPALPFSIALGVGFYLSSYYLMEGLVVPLATRCVYF